MEIAFVGACAGTIAALAYAGTVDACFGAELNLRKTKWGSTPGPLGQLGSRLASLQYVTQLKYLRIDVLLRGAVGSRSPRAVARCDLASRRVAFIRVLPAQQRGNLVADTVVGLYAAGVTAVSVACTTALTYVWRLVFVLGPSLPSVGALVGSSVASDLPGPGFDLRLAPAV